MIIALSKHELSCHSSPHISVNFPEPLIAVSCLYFSRDDCFRILPPSIWEQVTNKIPLPESSNKFYFQLAIPDTYLERQSLLIKWFETKLIENIKSKICWERWVILAHVSRRVERIEDEELVFHFSRSRIEFA